VCLLLLTTTDDAAAAADNVVPVPFGTDAGSAPAARLVVAMTQLTMTTCFYSMPIERKKTINGPAFCGGVHVASLVLFDSAATTR
jgi:hypothetical protein